MPGCVTCVYGQQTVLHALQRSGMRPTPDTCQILAHADRSGELGVLHGNGVDSSESDDDAAGPRVAATPASESDTEDEEAGGGGGNAPVHRQWLLATAQSTLSSDFDRMRGELEAGPDDVVDDSSSSSSGTVVGRVVAVDGRTDPGARRESSEALTSVRSGGRRRGRGGGDDGSGGVEWVVGRLGNSSVDAEALAAELSACTTLQLRAALAHLGLTKSGLKRDLVQRLVDSLQSR